MNAVATKPRAKAAPSAPLAKLRPQTSTPIQAPPFFWFEPTKLALQAMFDLIETAVDLELPENDSSNYACRVLQVARDLVSKEVESTDLAARSMARNEVANVAFDFFALLTAALNYPDEPLGVARIPLVKHACAIADRLADFHCYGTEASDPRGAEALPGLRRAIEAARAQLAMPADSEKCIEGDRGPAPEATPVTERFEINWLEICTANGGISDARILLEMLMQEAGFCYENADAAHQAQSRIVLLGNAVDGYLKTAEQFFDELVDKLQGAAS